MNVHEDQLNKYRCDFQVFTALDHLEDSDCIQQAKPAY